MSTLISLMRALVLRYILIVTLQMPWKKWRNNIYNDFHQNTVESRNNVIVNPPKAHTHTRRLKSTVNLRKTQRVAKKTVKQWAIMSNHHCPRPECASACSLDTIKSFINDSLEIIHQNLILMKCFGIPMKHGKFHGIVMG